MLRGNSISSNMSIQPGKLNLRTHNNSAGRLLRMCSRHGGTFGSLPPAAAVLSRAEQLDVWTKPQDVLAELLASFDEGMSEATPTDGSTCFAPSITQNGLINQKQNPGKGHGIECPLKNSHLAALTGASSLGDAAARRGKCLKT